MNIIELRNKLENIIGEPIYIDTTYEKSFGEDLYTHMHNLFVRFHCFGDSDDEVDIATLTIKIIDSEFSEDIDDEDYSMWNLMDAESCDLAEVAEDLGVLNWGEDIQFTNFNVLYEDYLFYLECFEVSENYRGKGIGNAIMSSIFDIICKATNLNPEYVVFIPYPFLATEETVDNDLIRLERFYSNIGAKPNEVGRTWVLEKDS